MVDRMKRTRKNGRIIIPANRKPWRHELRVAGILADAGFEVVFIPEKNVSTADILLDGVQFEIKSPFTNKPDKIERNIKRGLKQSKNIIIDASRIKNMRDDSLQRFLIRKAQEQKQIGRLILITKKGKIVDIRSLV